MGKKKITDRCPVAEHLRDRLVPVGDLKPDPNNCKKHDEKDLAGIMASLREFGQQRAILAQKGTKIIIAGNGTYSAACKLGWQEIAVDWTDLPPERARAYALVDNRTSQLSAWDELELAASVALVADQLPDLYNALQLEDLKVDTTSEDSLPSSVSVPEMFAVNVVVANEAEQKKLYEMLTRNGYQEVRLITT